MKKVIFTLLLLLPFLLMSQTPLIEPSWELMPGDGPIDKDNFLPLDIMEFNDGCYLVPVSMEKEKAIKFVKIDNDGGILQETVLQYDENSIISTFLLDMYNDTVMSLQYIYQKKMAVLWPLLNIFIYMKILV